MDRNSEISYILKKAKERFRSLLSGGDRRSVGRVAEVLALLAGDPDRVGELVSLLWDDDALIRMRAADALEKYVRIEPASVFQPWKGELLGLMAETEQAEVRWHLAAIVPRLQLKPAERSRAAEILRSYLKDRSSIVKTFALQGLWELSSADQLLRDEVIELLQEAVRTGTPAMRARGRKLLSLG